MDLRILFIAIMRPLSRLPYGEKLWAEGRQQPLSRLPRGEKSWAEGRSVN